MPVPKSLAKNLIDQYGWDKGKEIFYKMRSEKHPSYMKAMATAEKEGKGHMLKEFPRKPKKK